jgi:hypothetical protein
MSAMNKPGTKSRSRRSRRSRRTRGKSKNATPANVKESPKESPKNLKESPKNLKESPKNLKESPKESPKNLKESPKESPQGRKGLLPYEMKLTEYLNHEEPEFWKPLFKENEMFALRKHLHGLMRKDCEPVKSGWKSNWTTCAMVKEIIPCYSIPKTGRPYFPPEGGGVYGISSNDFSKMNVILCTSLLLFGTISHRMANQPYTFLLKGGKAIQLVLSKIQESMNAPNPIHISDYESEDIDILIRPLLYKPYDREEIKNLAGHLASLLKWFVDIEDIHCKVAIQPPEESKFNPNIYKLSYPIPNTKAFKALSDIDFKDLDEEAKVYYSRCIQHKSSIDLDSELDIDLTFKCPSHMSQLNEKLYYYSKYVVLHHRDHPEDGLTKIEHERFLDKFKRAILALNNGLQKQKHPKVSDIELKQLEIDFIVTKLKALDIPGINQELAKDLLTQGVNLPELNGENRMQIQSGKDLSPKTMKVVKEYILQQIMHKLYP